MKDATTPALANGDINVWSAIISDLTEITNIREDAIEEKKVTVKSTPIAWFVDIFINEVIITEGHPNKKLSKRIVTGQ